jgi:hypothetical protein
MILLIFVHRKQRKAKGFDPVSVDYIDIVDDWVVDRTAVFSGPAEQRNWMEINQTVSQITSREQSDDEFESFIEGMCICNPFLTLCLFSVLENQYQNL